MDHASDDGQDFRVRDLTSVCLTRRSDLVYTPHREGNEVCYLIEDPVRSQFFRVGLAEYLLISMFDGKTTIGQALIRLARHEGDFALSESEATAVCKWLISNELASTPASLHADRLSESASSRESQRRLAALNPLCLKFPLFHPDRFFARITPWCRHAFGGVAALIGFIVLCIAAQRVCFAWDPFMQSAQGIASPGRWLWLLGCWAALKFIHESAHAIVCRKYGGQVHEAGVILVLFVPLAYVDLTSSWRFRSKWQRMYTAAAGMYIELWIAGLAAIIWSASGPGLLNDLSFNLVVMASLTTLVFNANPLMRFDGYYMLSDWLEIPNLYSEGQQYLQSIGRKYILGERVHQTLAWNRRCIFIRIYGVAALLWRIFICVSLVIGASMLFDGLGLILAVIAVVMWVAFPLLRLMKYVRREDGLQRFRTARLLVATTVLLLLVTGLLNHVPWPVGNHAAVIVQYEPLAFARADSPGFVREILVAGGQQVRAGDPLARLENRQLVAELNDLELAIELSVLKSRVFRQADEMHSYQAEMDQLFSLQTKRDERKRQVDLLIVRAPVDGTVIARDLHLKMGTYLHVGDEIAAVGDESRKELRLAIRQTDFEPFKNHIGKTVDVRLPGGVVFRAPVERVIPRASSTAPDQSMYASNGGPLPSRVKGETANADEKMELLAPHFTGVVDLTAAQSVRIRVGQRGVVWFGRGGETVGSVLKRKVREALPRSFVQQYAWLLVPRQRGL